MQKPKQKILSKPKEPKQKEEFRRFYICKIKELEGWIDELIDESCILKEKHIKEIKWIFSIGILIGGIIVSAIWLISL